MNPVHYAILARLDRALPEGLIAPAPGDYGAAHVAVTVTAAGESATYAADLAAVKVGAPTLAAPTASALTLAGVARMLAALDAAGVVAPHVRARALSALFADYDPPANYVQEVEAVRAAAARARPPIARAGTVRATVSVPFRRV